ncbi:MAG TPA: hypothetical protein ENN56_01900 [Firmicutes bacterium]|nr:hypothetical protein [Bacillota bacterium]
MAAPVVIISIRRVTAMKRYRIPIIFVQVFFALCSFPVLSHAAVASDDGVTAFSRLDEAKLRESMRSYAGTPYRYGGTSKNGIDCSGFTFAVYREQGITLPRTVREQFRVGQSVSRSQLAVGDLVFFNTAGTGPSHVGIVSGPARFFHGSTSKGVIEDDLNSDLWRRRFVGARRIASARTFTIRGDRVGASASDRVVLINRYPFTTYSLVNVPTNQVGEARSLSLGFTTNSSGDMVIAGRSSMWNRIELAGFLPVTGALDAGAPGVKQPDGLVKLRINDQWHRIPGFAIGYDTRRARLIEETIYGDSVRVTNRRGLFIVGSGNLTYRQGFLIGETRFHAGASIASVGNVESTEDVGVFVGLEQQLLRRIALVGEVDNLFGERAAHINAGIRITVTDDAVLEYAVTAIGPRHYRPEKVLRFSFHIPY